MPPRHRTASIRSATIKDVAKAAGVSKSTVSLVLQESPLIRPETAERVREAAERLGYVYNRQAALLRQRTSKLIGVVINDLANPFFSELLVGIERRLEAAGYVCLMAHTDERLDIQSKVLATMREYHATGIILCPAFGTSDVLLDTVQKWNIPLVIVIRPLGKGSCDFVGSDYEAGMNLGTEHLISQGHQRIAFLGRTRGGAVSEQRRKGYKCAMNRHKLPVATEWMINVPPTRAGGHQGMQQLLALPNPPTAAVCYNDIVAFGALSALGQSGLKAGQDLALIGFDGVAATEYSNPPLSTINTDPERLGETAADVLLQRLAEPEHSPIRHLTKPQLLIRSSSSGG